MAAGPTFTPIATTTLGSSQTSVSFSSFSGYTDLRLIASILPTGAGAAINLTVNSDTSTNYSWTALYGTGTAAVSSRTTNFANLIAGYGLGSSTTIPTQFDFNFQNYSNSTTYKTLLTRFTDNSQGLTGAAVSPWRNTAVITSIQIVTPTSSYAAGSTFTLYGILAA